MPVRAMALRMGDLEVEPSVSTTGKYDSNILQTDTDRISDYLTDLTGAVNITSETKLQMIGLKGALTREMYLKQSALDNTSENLNLTYARQPDRYTMLNAADTFDHTETPTSFTDAFGRTPGRYAYYLNRFNVNYGCDMSKQFSWSANYANEIYDPSRQDLSSSQENALSLRGDYALTSTTTLFGVYGLSSRSFDPGGRVTAHTLDGAVREFFSAKTYMDLIAGISATTGVDGSRSNAPRYEATLSHEISGKTKANLSFSQRTDTTYSSSDLFKSWRVTTSLDHRLYSRLSCSGELFLGQGKYTQIGIQDKFDGASTRVNYALTPAAELSAGYTYSKTGSTLDSRRYTRGIATVGATVKF